MSEITDAIGDGIGSFVGSPIVQLALRSIGVYIVVLWLATAFLVWRDLGRRIESPLAPYLGAAAIIIASPILFPAAWLVIRLLRPDTTIGERRAEALELALLDEELPRRCEGCAGRVRDDWLVCPTCGQRLARRCEGCNGVLQPAWDLCPWCVRDLRPGIVREAGPAPRPAGEGLRPSQPRPVKLLEDLPAQLPASPSAAASPGQATAQ